jgi:hypothetical protein
VPDDMDGRVLTDAFTDPFRVAYPVVQCEADPAPEGRAYAWSEEDEEALQDRLKSLGYMA